MPFRLFPKLSAIIPDDWLADYPAEPWGEIRATGNKMQHEYFRIEDEILWEIVTRYSYNLETVMFDMVKHLEETE